MSWKRFIAIQSEPNSSTYPSLPDDITYFRLLIGLLCGLYFSVREYQQYSLSTSGGSVEYSMSGFVGIVVTMNFVTFIPIIYINFYLNADLDSYQGKLNFAGVMNGFALSLLLWISAFTMIHEKEEMALSQTLLESSNYTSLLKNATNIAVKTILRETIVGNDGNESFSSDVSQTEF